MKEALSQVPQSLIVYKINPNDEELAGDVTFDRNVDGRIFSGCNFYILNNTIIIENEIKEVEGIFSLSKFYFLKR